MRNLDHILDYMTQTRWALLPRYLTVAENILSRGVAGVRLDAEEIARITEDKTQKASEQRTYRVLNDGTAVLPITGVIAKYSNQVNGTSQPRGTSLEKLAAQFKQAMEDPFVNHIVLQIESPGGSIAGLFDFADEIYHASEIKPITAYIDDMACSAACLLASQANVTYANQTAQCACIGVYMMLLDSSEAAKKEGLKFVIIRSGQHKGVGAEGIVITDENIAVMQANIDYDHEMFVKAVLRGRGEFGMTADGLAAVADGRVLTATDAVKVHLIDGIKTLDAVLAEPKPKTRTLTQQSGELKMETKDLASFKASHPELYKLAFDEGVASGRQAADADEKKRCADIIAACGDDSALAVECISGDKTAADAMSARTAKLAKENAELKEAAKNNSGKQAVDPAAAAFNDDVNGKGDLKKSATSSGGEPDYKAMTQEQLKGAYSESAALQKEFGSEAAFLAYVKAEQKGSIR